MIYIVVVDVAIYANIIPYLAGIPAVIIPSFQEYLGLKYLMCGDLLSDLMYLELHYVMCGFLFSGLVYLGQHHLTCGHSFQA